MSYPINNFENKILKATPVSFLGIERSPAVNSSGVDIMIYNFSDQIRLNVGMLADGNFIVYCTYKMINNTEVTVYTNRNVSEKDIMSELVRSLELTFNRYLQYLQEWEEKVILFKEKSSKLKAEIAKKLSIYSTML